MDSGFQRGQTPVTQAAKRKVTSDETAEFKASRRAVGHGRLCAWRPTPLKYQVFHRRTCDPNPK